MELLRIGKRTYAVGLDVWLSLESHTQINKVARKKAESLHFPVYALRPSPVPQIGLVKEVQKGALKGKVFSLAAAIAGAQPESWSGLFALPNEKWWVLSIYNGVIISNGDLLADEAAARSQFDKELARLPGDIQPVEISDPEESIKWLTDNISDRYQAVLKTTESHFVVIAGGSIIGAAVLGAGLWWHHEQVVAAQQKKDHLALLRMLAAEKKHSVISEKNQLVPAKKAVPIVLPWKGKLSYGAWAAAVKAVVAPLPLADRGWVLSAVTCDQATCVVTWHRSSGATVWDAPHGIIDPNGNRVTTAYPLEKGPIPYTETVPAPVAGTARKLQGWIQELGINGGVQAQMLPRIPIPVNTAQKPMKPAPTWTTRQFSFSLSVPPWEISGPSLPGLVIQSATWTPDNSNWHFKGVIYGPAH